MSVLASLFLENLQPERLCTFLGQPVARVNAELRAWLGNDAFAVLEATKAVKGIPPRTAVFVRPYVDSPASVKAISLSLDSESRLKEGLAPAAFVESVRACWEGVRTALPDRVGALTKRKTLYPQKKPVAAAAPALRAALTEAWDFEGGCLEHHATTQRDVLFTYHLTVTFRRA